MPFIAEGEGAESQSVKGDVDGEVAGPRDDEATDPDAWDQASDGHFRSNDDDFITGPGRQFLDERTRSQLSRPQITIQEIPLQCDRRAFRQTCEGFGRVLDFKMMNSHNEKFQHAFVTYDTMDSAHAAAKELRMVVLGETPLKVGIPKTKEQRDKEREERRKENELYRDCGFSNVLDAPSANVKRCDHCGRDEANLKRLPIRYCTGCWVAAYCSVECQREEFSKHKRTCTAMVEKRKKKKLAKKAAAAAQESEAAAAAGAFDKVNKPVTSEAKPLETPDVSKLFISEAKIVFKDLLANEVNFGMILSVVDPGDFCVAPDDDDPLAYQLLNSYLAAFMEQQQITQLLENPKVGDAVVAKIPRVDNDEDEDSYQRAVVVHVYESPTEPEPAALLELWFCDAGVAASDVPVSSVVSLSDFRHFLRRNNVDVSSATLPARLIRCHLCAICPDDGESRPIVPGREGLFEEDQEDHHEDPDATPEWDEVAVAFLKKLIFTRMEVRVISKDENVVPKFGVTMSKKEIGVGDSLVDVGLADFDNH